MKAINNVRLYRPGSEDDPDALYHLMINGEKIEAVNKGSFDGKNAEVIDGRDSAEDNAEKIRNDSFRRFFGLIPQKTGDKTSLDMLNNTFYTDCRLWFLREIQLKKGSEPPCCNI
ncbi:hypothetical protein [Planomicrobium sp. CPCC 101079]|uniref:hypothetical protein n=1 Tax=Planomicrobium sp. CPCC 101079 TaxID=2599618 RepID=UPI0011B60771|nr:hypothetical protein [Planomicrobium sp. CPCC 101079]TWT13233.1 hypothetical protein FQV28_02815 [Planomicrobium sp. CPCC 101079]